MTELNERLGFGPRDRVAVVSGVRFGCTHATTAAIYEGLRSGGLTTADLMVPCAWARHAAAQHRGEDIGVQLTLNAELDQFRWGPITHAPSLLDGDGGFPRTIGDLWDHADVDEVRRECRAQLDRAVLWGFDITHLSSHLGALELRPEFFDVYLDLACELALPLRLAGPDAEGIAGFPLRALARDEGVLFPDDVRVVRGADALAADALTSLVDGLAPGVTELVVEPAIDTPELRAVDPQWRDRIAAHDAVTAQGSLTEALRRAGVATIGYRRLRDAQRAG